MKKILKRFIPKKVLNLRHLFFAWYGAVKHKHPSKELLVIGVTGTSGKSSTVYILRQILEVAGYTVGSLSTIDFYIAGEDKLNDQKMTMLGRMQTQKYLREMVDKKCDIAIVETTSEGRVQHRHRFIHYDMMTLTNLYPEHIESHGSFEAYKRAKLDLFEYVSTLRRKRRHKTEGLRPKTAIVNTNSEYANEFLDFNFERKVVFGRNDQKSYVLHPTSYVLADEVRVILDGLHFTIENKQFHAPLYGEHNVMNITAAISVVRQLDVKWDVLQKAVESLKPIPGRVEFISEAKEYGFDVIVDYAFEPKAMSVLYQVVKLIKPLRQAQGKPPRIIHVFGSTGGGRDKARRFSLGEMIGEQADMCIVTDEDPYEDDPMEIINDVAMAVEKTGKVLNTDLFKILDRREAIEKAVALAQKGDVILVTGKGSEQKMCVAGGKMISWDDREIVRKSLKVKSS